MGTGGEGQEGEEIGIRKRLGGTSEALGGLPSVDPFGDLDPLPQQIGVGDPVSQSIGLDPLKRAGRAAPELSLLQLQLQNQHRSSVVAGETDHEVQAAPLEPRLCS